MRIWNEPTLSRLTDFNSIREGMPQKLYSTTLRGPDLNQEDGGGSSEGN